MSLELFGFIVLSAGLLATATVVVIARNPIHCALSLIASFFFLAGIYLTLNANFVAVIQVLVYAGAIMVLFLFVIMLLNLSDEELGESRWNLHKVIGALGALMLAVVMIWAIVGAQRDYLTEPATLRSHTFERLRAAATEYAFPSQVERNAYFARLTRLWVLAGEKVRLERGSETTRQSACTSVARFATDIDAAGCADPQVQVAARGFAGAELADFDHKLAELEAEVDASPVPAQWRGASAERIPGSEPSRRERAILEVLEISVAIQLDRLVDGAAARLLSVEQIAGLDAVAMESPGTVSTPDTDIRTQRALSTSEPGGRLALAKQRAGQLVELAKDGGEELKRFEASQQKLLGDYETAAREVLTDVRAQRMDRVVQRLAMVHQQTRQGMTEIEAGLVRGVLRDLARRQPRFAGLTTRPVIYDQDEFGSVNAVGRELFTTFLLPFEVTSVLLLVGILGAVVIAKRKM